MATMRNFLFSVMASTAFALPQLSNAQDNNSQGSPDDEPIKMCQIIDTSVYPNGLEQVKFGTPYLTTESQVIKSIDENKKIAGPGFSQRYVCQEAPSDVTKEYKDNVQACLKSVGDYQKLTKGVADGQLLISPKELDDSCRVLPSVTQAVTAQLIRDIKKKGRLKDHAANLDN